MSSKPFTHVSYPIITPPSLKKQIGEVKSAFYLADLLKLKSIPKPENLQQKTIMVIPGLFGGELSIMGLKHFLRYQGYQTYSWQLGFNHGKIEQFLSPLSKRVHDLYEKHERPVHLVGWSLGGLIAREMARYHPDLVESIVTLGSPIVGGPNVTALKKFSRLFGWDKEAIERQMKQRFYLPINNKITALYSKQDGIVSWQACIDNWSPQVEHHEVSATHIGMGFSQEVFRVLSKVFDPDDNDRGSS